jgi:type I restriction enzyme R subunit
MSSSKTRKSVSPAERIIMNAVMDALAAHTTMSKQAIGSQRVREGFKEVLLGPVQLYEALRDKAGEQGWTARD